MAFNFKKNLLIIMLLIIVILSTIVYINIQNIKETFVSNNRIDSVNIILESRDTSYNYYKLNTTANHYIIKNFSMVSPYVDNYLRFVKTVSGETYRANTASEIKTYYKSNNALIGHYVNDNSLSLYNIVLPNVILDVSAITRSTTYTNSINLLLIEREGYLYDFSNNKLTTTIKINNVDIIKSGVFQETPQTTTTVTPTAPETPTAVASVGDINFTGFGGGFGGGLGLSNSLTGISNELFLYLLNRGAFGSSYVPPIYNNFETAMNLASNPIVNPVNSMNPLEYAQTLFGPGVTPMMSKNSTLNSDTKVASAKDEATTNTTNTTNKSAGKSNTNTSMKDMFKFDTDGNLLSQNIGKKNSDSNYTKITKDDDTSKSKCAPCPAPQRCPESNFECKKVPNYEQGLDNAFLPRPVLADFSTFGM